MKRASSFQIFTVALLIAGNAVGAGILALPVKTGLSGILPSVVSMIIMWALMLLTGMLIANRIMRSRHESHDMPTFFLQEIGPHGKWLCILGYLVLFYGVLVAYLSGGASILSALIPLSIPEPVWLLLFFIAATTITLYGVDLVRKWNAIIMLVLLASFISLSLKVGQNVEAQRLSHSDWAFLPSILPIIVCTFPFHNLVPVVCKSLNNQRRAILMAILIGTSITLIMNISWTVIVVGSLPLTGPGEGNLLAAFEKGLPATVPLSLALNSNLITTIGTVFALTAILTSYLAVGLSLMGFFRDLTSPYLKNSNRLIDACLTFGPPLLIALIYPHLFLKALDVAGGIGVILVFGVLPAVIFVKSRRGKTVWARSFTYLILGIFVLLLLLEFSQELGFLKIHPGAEYWSTGLKP